MANNLAPEQPMPKPELRTMKPPEVKAPEVKPLGQTEQAMVARIDKDGDPDLVLQDLARVEMPQPAKEQPTTNVGESAVNQTKESDGAFQQISTTESSGVTARSDISEEPASPQQKYIVTRNGQMVEATLDQMTPEERAAFEESTEEPPNFEHDPVEDPSGFLDYLKQRNSSYAYDSDFTPEMVKKAVEWAQSRGLDPSGLSPAQIILSKDYVPGTKTQEEVAKEVIEERTIRLRSNKDELASIIEPAGTTFFHATPVLENVQSILENGLYCDSALGLSGSAEPLDSLPHNVSPSEQEQIAESNIRKLANPHRGYRYEVVMQLPPLTPEQHADYQARRANNENVSFTSYYVQKLPEQVGAQGAEITYDAVLPPQYMKGFIDLDTGQFILRQPASR